MSESDTQFKNERIKDVMGRMKVLKVQEWEELIMILARILQMIENK